MTRAALALAGLLLLGACGDDPQPPVYDRQTAFRLASLEMAPGTAEFLLFDVNPEGKVADQGRELAARLADAAGGERRALAVVGPDPAHNRRVLAQALDPAAPAGDGLTGIDLIVVGPAAERGRIRRLVAGHARHFAYVVYP